MKCLTAVALSAILWLTYLEYAEATTCGYESCPITKTNMINVHLVPHSHDDTGWLKTIDQYYYGSRNGIQRAGVQYILDGVVEELLKDERRRFIIVEIYFFCKWYLEQNDEKKNEVKQLINEGRIEIVGGGYSMNDEAVTNYQSIIDQFTFSINFLNKTFGACGRPRVGWQIDPFGHSREMASLFAQMGYDGEFFARLDWVDKSVRLRNLTGEMIWQASENLGEQSELFTSILYNHYSAPPGFCFDSLCADDPIIDGDSYDNNVNEKVDAFLAYVTKQSLAYRSSHILVPMGDDFNYGNANMNFKNMDKLIKHANLRQLKSSKIHLFYSSPSCYLNALHKDLQLTWPTKTQDFFPYSTDYHSYWTGYYTSRPTQKKFERDANNLLQISKQLTTLAHLNTSEAHQNLDKLKHAMGIMQHHDAITGTERQHVANDYIRLLTDGLNAVTKNNILALRKLFNWPQAEFDFCLQLNITLCKFTQEMSNRSFVVSVFNPLNRPYSHYIRIPVENGAYVVTDESGREMPYQVLPIPKPVLALDNSNINFNKTELVFKVFVKKFANFYIKPNSKYEATTTERLWNRTTNFVVENSLITLHFNTKGFLENVEMNGFSENIKQEFLYYVGALGNNTQFKYRSSGAYIFRPDGLRNFVGAEVKIYEGKLVKEVHQYINPYLSQVIRLYDDINSVEFEWMVGPIPIDDGDGKEFITRFTSNINSNRVFYTDANGRELMKRVRDEREGFQPMLNESISSNYYPVTTRIALESKTKRMTLITDRPQGGSSLGDGILELMLHRRLLHDDAFGVGEALNETVNGEGLITRGKTQLLLNRVGKNATIQERYAAQELHLPYGKFFSDTSKTFNFSTTKLPTFSLPMGIEILTLEPCNQQQYLLRFENILDKTEISNVTFNIRQIFDTLGGKTIQETTLDGNMLLSNMKRFKFPTDGTVPSKVEYYTAKYTPLSAVYTDNIETFSITMEPMQIRTFIINNS